MADLLQLWETLATPWNAAVALATSIFLFALYHTVIYPLYLSPLRTVPGPPYAGPLAGHFGQVMTREPGIASMDWAKIYGPVVRTVGPFGRDGLIVFRPEALTKILVTDWQNYPRPKFVRNVLGTVAGYGLLTVTGEDHRQMRRAMNPAFSLTNLMSQTEMYFDHIDVLADIMRTQLEDAPQGKVMHMYEWVSKTMLDIICDTAFGYRTNALTDPTNPLLRAYESLLELESGENFNKYAFILSLPYMATLANHRIIAPFLASIFRYIPGLTSFETLVKGAQDIRNISRSLLRERIMESGLSADDVENRKDIMSVLVRAREGVKHGYKLSDEALVDQVLTFLGAGHETTAAGISWALWLLAKHPDIQDELRAELAPVFDANPRPSYREMKDLKMLECVVMESLRLLPSIPLTLREATCDDWVDGTFVPKGTLIHIAIRAVNTWSGIWGGDAEAFRPSRWLDLPEEYNPSFSLLSFIAGPHACIGKTMGISGMKMLIAATIANFELRPAYPGQVPKLTAAITMKPEDNLPLLVKRVKRA